jgi:hypothetical protein
MDGSSLPPRKEPPPQITHWLWSWVGYRADDVKRSICSPVGNQIHCPVRRQSLHWMSDPGSYHIKI